MVVPGEYIFRFEAIDPTTGGAVAGVSVSNVSIFGENVFIGAVPERKVPALTPEEVEGL